MSHLAARQSTQPAGQWMGGWVARRGLSICRYKQMCGINKYVFVYMHLDMAWRSLPTLKRKQQIFFSELNAARMASQILYKCKLTSRCKAVFNKSIPVSIANRARKCFVFFYSDNKNMIAMFEVIFEVICLYTCCMFVYLCVCLCVIKWMHAHIHMQ